MLDKSSPECEPFSRQSSRATWWQARSHEQTSGLLSSWYEGMNACKQVGYMRQGLASHFTQDEWRTSIDTTASSLRRVEC